jgi:hypothetical protein
MFKRYFCKTCAAKYFVNCLLGPYFVEGHTTATSFRSIPEV